MKTDRRMNQTYTLVAFASSGRSSRNFSHCLATEREPLKMPSVGYEYNLLDLLSNSCLLPGQQYKFT